MMSEKMEEYLLDEIKDLKEQLKTALEEVRHLNNKITVMELEKKAPTQITYPSYPSYPDTTGYPWWQWPYTYPTVTTSSTLETACKHECSHKKDK